MNSIPELIEDIRNGKMVVLVDDEDRENEGDLVVAADFISPEIVNFMVQEARGLVCLAMSAEQIEKLRLPLMVSDERNHSPNKTAFTVSIEASQGVSTGISAADRAHTIRVASRPHAKPSDVIIPGHIFPIRAQPGGVLKRAGHTEGSVDLVSLAGLNAAAAICEVMNADGTMARVVDLKKFAIRHQLKIGTIVDLIRYRIQNETFVKEVARARMPNRFGDDYETRIFRNLLDGTEHMVLQKGEITMTEPVLVRVQVENVVADVFGDPHSGRLDRAMELIEQQGRGILVYLRQNGGLNLSDQVRVVELRDQGLSQDEINTRLSLQMDERDYGVGAQILRALGVRQIRLLGSSTKRVGLKGYGLEIVEEVPLIRSETDGNKNEPGRYADRDCGLSI